MIRDLIDKISLWYNDQHGDKKVYLFLAFCVAFLLLLWLSIRFIHFNPSIYSSGVPTHIGKPSGDQLTDSLTIKKH